MLKVLIVDDEAIFRTGIRFSVDWEALGFEVCGEAQNGREAIEKIYQLKPQVVFLDIKMPEMGGLEVLEELKGKMEDVCFIVLSSFNEYEFVRKAMKAGSYDYLFKPVMEAEDIVRVLKEIRERNYLTDVGGTTREISACHRVQELLKSGLNGDRTPAQEEELRLLQPELFELPYFVFMISVFSKGGLSLPTDKISNICQTIIQQNLDADALYMLDVDSGNLLKGICFQESLRHVHFSFQEKEWRRIVSYQEEYLQANVQIGLSRVSIDLRQEASVGKQSQNALDCVFFQDEKGIVFYSERFGESYDFKKLYEEQMEEIFDALTGHRIEEIPKILSQINEDICRNRYFNRTDYCHFMAEMIVTFMRKIKNGAILEEMLLSDYDMISNLYHQRCMKDTTEETYRILQQVYQKLYGASGNGAQTEIVQKAVKYINENYQSRISLDEISAYVHVNKNYFCKIFKNETGENFVTFVTRLRVEKATEMLRTSEKKIYEIAMDVGFQDYHHFCKTYKEYTGATPSDIRKQEEKNV